jgi:hypothetical protein
MSRARRAVTYAALFSLGVAVATAIHDPAGVAPAAFVTFVLGVLDYALPEPPNHERSHP